MIETRNFFLSAVQKIRYISGASLLIPGTKAREENFGVACGARRDRRNPVPRLRRSLFEREAAVNGEGTKIRQPDREDTHLARYPSLGTNDEGGRLDLCARVLSTVKLTARLCLFI